MTYNPQGVDRVCTGIKTMIETTLQKAFCVTKGIAPTVTQSNSLSYWNVNSLLLSTNLTSGFKWVTNRGATSCLI